MLSPYKKGKFRLTGIYGTRRDPFTGAAVAHHGVDLVGIDSKEICAVTDGKVVRSRIVPDPADRTSQWGEYIAVMAPDGGIVYYCHLSRRLAGVGDTVKRGEHAPGGHRRSSAPPWERGSPPACGAMAGGALDSGSRGPAP